MPSLSNTHHFLHVCSLVFPRPSKALSPVPTFASWENAHIFRLSSDFRKDVLSKLELQSCNALPEQITLHVWQPSRPLSFLDARSNLPRKQPVPWVLLDLLRGARDDNTNDVLPAHGLPTLLCIPGPRSVDSEGKPIGNPGLLPITMCHPNGFGGRSPWELDQWNVLDTQLCPMDMRLITGE